MMIERVCSLVADVQAPALKVVEPFAFYDGRVE